LQRLSGITLTSRYVEQIKGLKTKIVDTRKTTPCLRFMEKYAVRTGGGCNHRFGLFDGILIKDNHIKAVGVLQKAIDRAKTATHLSKRSRSRLKLSAGSERLFIQAPMS
jgi:nicotinate-nucleotide pyrophosphorylase (carboxylating)